MLKLGHKILVLIGKPFYFLLTRLFLGLLLAFSLTGHLILKISKIRPPQIKPRFVRAIRVKLAKIKFPRLKPKLGLEIGLISFLFLIFYFSILKDLPSPRQLTNRDPEVSTKIYDRNGTLLYKIFKDKNRTLITLNDVPLHVRLATLAAEDAEFYSHPGFSIRGILRSLVRNLARGELAGGSTITQQLVKEVLLSPEKTLARKIRELILAIEVEILYSKDQILEMYLNETPYGGTAYGIAEAADQYFGKKVKDLTLAEAAFLAGLPKSPTKFSPFGNNPEAGIARQKEVLHLMRVNKFISNEQEAEALNQKLILKANKTNILAPHFVMYVRSLLTEKYGEEIVEKGGLEVITSLDLSLQNLAQEIVKTEVDKLKGLNVKNGAALILNPSTGEILAMVGSKDYFDLANDGNVNVTLRPRQPGSSIKVINYAYALAHGFTPASFLDDSPAVFQVAGLPPYIPRNYDGTYRGKLTLRSALAESRNIPAVKVLASYGVNKMLELGRQMGITTWNDPSRYGLSLTLGGGEVKLIDLARVYATIANYGKRPEIKPILEVKNYKGKVLEKNNCPGTRLSGCPATQVIDPRVAFLLIDILKDNLARSPAFGSNSYLVIPNHPEVAVKTGTSNNLKDNLTLGFNQKYLVAVWVGNNDASSMSRIASGVTGASPIWNKIMRALLANDPDLTSGWEVPEGLVRKNCFGKEEWFLKENVPACTPLPQAINPPRRGQVSEPAAQTQVN